MPAEGPTEAVFHARVTENLDLCDHVARQMMSHVGSNIPFDELVAIGREALTIAAKSFDDARGVPFRRYANLRVKGGVIDGIRQRGSVPRRVYKALRAIEAAEQLQEALVEDMEGAPTPTPEEADAKVGQYLNQAAVAMAMSFLSLKSLDKALDVADEDGTPEEQVSREELLSKMQGAVKSLSPEEQQIIQGHYFGGKTVAEVGRELGLSKSWACRIHARAVEQIAAQLGVR
jgi:RNA polymerase sigma factor for flagellar operon FliA